MGNPMTMIQGAAGETPRLRDSQQRETRPVTAPSRLRDRHAAADDLHHDRFLACDAEKHEQLRVNLVVFVANVCGLYEYTSGLGRYLSGSCATCHGDLSLRIGPVLDGALVYTITRDVRS